MSTYETIVDASDRSRARITLNHPERHNAITKRMECELHDALWRADAGPEVRFLVRHRLSSGAHGLTDEDIALWADDGRLLLRARQLHQGVALSSFQSLSEAGRCDG